MCEDVTTDLIIGLPSIKFFNLPILQGYLDTKVCCEIYPVAEGDRAMNWKTLRVKSYGPTKNDTDQRERAKGIPAKHLGYVGEMRTQFAEINSVTENVTTPTYSTSDIIQALQGLHM